MQRLSDLLQGFLRATRVPPAALATGVQAAVAELWPSMDTSQVEILAFRGGVLHLALDHPARIAEARSFHAQELRERINHHVGRELAAGPKRGPRAESLYVVRITFHVPGSHG